MTRAVWATRMLFAANGGFFATWVSRIPQVRDDLHANDAGLGLALLGLGLGSLLAMPASGRVIARVGQRPVLLASIALAIVDFPLLGLVGSLPLLGVTLGVFGASAGVWDVAMNVAGHDVEVRAGRTLMPGFHAFWSLGGVSLAGLGALAARVGLTPLEHFAVAAAALGLLALLATARLGVTGGAEAQAAEAAEAAASEAAARRAVGAGAGADLSEPEVGVLVDPHEGIAPPRPRWAVTDRRVLALGALTFCAAWAEGSANDWLALLLADDRGASAALAAVGFAVFATAMTTGRLIGNRIVGTLGRVRALRWGAAVAAVGLTVLLGLPRLELAYLGAVGWGLGIAVAFPLAMSAAGETPGRGPQTIAAVATMGYVGFLVGPPLMGALAHQIGLGSALWLVVGLVAGVAALAGAARPVAADRAGAAPG